MWMMDDDDVVFRAVLSCSPAPLTPALWVEAILSNTSCMGERPGGGLPGGVGVVLHQSLEVDGEASSPPAEGGCPSHSSAPSVSLLSSPARAPPPQCPSCLSQPQLRPLSIPPVCPSHTLTQHLCFYAKTRRCVFQSHLL